MFRSRTPSQPLAPFKKVTCEDGQSRLVNLETVGLIERHEHALDVQGHGHEAPVVLLKLLNGEELIVLDDGEWGL